MLLCYVFVFAHYTIKQYAQSNTLCLGTESLSMENSDSTYHVIAYIKHFQLDNCQFLNMYGTDLQSCMVLIYLKDCAFVVQESPSVLKLQK